MANRKICLVALFCCSVLLLPSMSVGECTFNDDELKPDAKSPYDTNPAYAWPKGKIPYVFTSNVGYADKKVFEKNMALIEEHTCFRYSKAYSAPRNQKYLEIHVDGPSCANLRFSAYVTSQYVRTKNKMYLHSRYQLADDAVCRKRANIKSMNEGGILHEMFHSLGVMHTQKRADRDKYVRVNNYNIANPSQYSICAECKIFPGIPYECNSVMHYGTNTFRKKNAGPTMTSVNRSCKLTEGGGGSPTDNDWKLLKIIADRVCGGSATGGSGTGGSGYWSSWRDYGYCSVTCGYGKVEQRRACTGGNGCQGESKRYATCKKKTCRWSWFG